MLNDIQVKEAEAEKRSRLRVAARKIADKERFEAEKNAIEAEYLAKISHRGKPNLPSKVAQTPPVSPGATSGEDDYEDEEA